ncbi:hypothetical protein Tco_0424249 [Tanacetum coccineum]
MLATRGSEGNHKGHKVPRAHTTRPINKKAYADLYLCATSANFTIMDCALNQGNETRLNIISCTKTQKYLLKGHHVFLAHVTTKETEDKSGEKRLEDVPINKKEHEEHSKAILELLKKEELYAKFSKCEFWIPKLIYEKSNKGSQKLLRPMTKLTQKKVAFEWGDKQEAAIQTLKNNGVCSKELEALLVWNQLLIYYDCEIRYHSGKANVVVDALSRKERIKPLRVRALVMTIGLDLLKQILNAQTEAQKAENLKNKHVGESQHISSLEDLSTDLQASSIIIDYGVVYHIVLRAFGKVCKRCYEASPPVEGVLVTSRFELSSRKNGGSSKMVRDILMLSLKFQKGAISSLPNGVDSNPDIYPPPHEDPLLISDSLFYLRPPGKTRKSLTPPLIIILMASSANSSTQNSPRKVPRTDFIDLSSNESSPIQNIPINTTLDTTLALIIPPPTISQTIPSQGTNVSPLAPRALVFSTPPSSPFEPHPYLTTLDDLPPRNSNPPPPSLS